jgi:hypothetical protein
MSSLLSSFGNEVFRSLAELTKEFKLDEDFKTLILVP